MYKTIINSIPLCISRYDIFKPPTHFTCKDRRDEFYIFAMRHVARICVRVSLVFRAHSIWKQIGFFLARFPAPRTQGEKSDIKTEESGGDETDDETSLLLLLLLLKHVSRPRAFVASFPCKLEQGLRPRFPSNILVRGGCALDRNNTRRRS